MLKFFLFFFSTYLLAQPMKLDQVRLELNWKHQFEFAGYYIAKEKGFYKDVGLDVEILEYQKGRDIVKDVEDIKQEGIYAIGYPSIILQRANGSDIVLINAMAQVSPHVLLTLKSSGIEAISDFKHKKIMIQENALFTASFLAMIKAHNIDIKDLQRVDPTFNIEALVKGDVDIFSAYLSNETFELKRKGIDFTIWNPADYGFDFYDDILFTSVDELKNYPSRVESFKRASLKGWQYAFEHIDETINLILKKYNSQNKTKKALLFEAKVLKKLAFQNGVKLGTIEENKIKRILDIYNILGLVQANNAVEDFLYKSPQEFSLTQKEQTYLQDKKTIKLCIDPNWMPYESFSNGKYIGMSADYFKLIEKQFSLNIDVVFTHNWTESLQFVKERKCDMLSLAMYTPQRGEYLNFTSPYLKIPLVIVTKNNSLFIDDISMLRGKKLAITKGYAFKELLLQKYPYLDLIEVDNIEDGLLRVQKGEFYAYIGTLMSASYAIQRKFSGELKISGKFNETWKLGIGVRNDDLELFYIMQKAVLSIDEHQKQKIFNDWIAVEYIKEIDYELFFKVFGVATVITIFLWLLYKKEKQLKEELAIKNIVFDTIINTIENPMFYKDKDGIYQNVNKVFAQDILGVDPKMLIGKTLNDLDNVITKEAIAFYNAQDAKLYRDGKNQVYEMQILTKRGMLKDFRIQKNLFYSQDGEVLGYVGFMYDITDIKEREKELELKASTDPMTHLYNRRYFAQMGETLFSLAKREHRDLSLIMLDIDNFKKVNDTYGHKVGDDVIITIAKTLQHFSRENDIACRFGGEEFILLLPETDIKNAEAIAQKIRKHIESLSVELENAQVLKISVSIGVALVQHNISLEKSIKNADDALYRAKENGKNCVEVFSL